MLERSWMLVLVLAGLGEVCAQTPLDPVSGTSRVTPIVRVVRQVGPTVVNLYSNVEYVVRSFGGARRSEAASLGAGVIVHPSGIVVTNSHVITANLREDILRDIDITVSYRPDWSDPDARTREFKARLLGFDPANDLALLKINAAGPFPAARIGTAADLMVGETVVAVGNPLGREGTVTHGIVSATNRRLAGPSGEAFDDIIQTDAPLNAGNSGGPLFNIQGDLIGINQAIGVDRRLGRAEGQGLAIPADRVRGLLEQEFSPYSLGHSYLGLRLESSPAELLRVQQVDPRSPADDSGIRAGDRIVQVGSYPVSDLISFNMAVFSYAAGSSIPITLEGTSRQRIAQVRVSSIQDTVRRRLGLDLKIDPRYRGPVVRRVNPDGPSNQLGIRRDDVILRLGSGRDRVESWQDIFEALLNESSQGEVYVLIERTLAGSRATQQFEGELSL